MADLVSVEDYKLFLNKSLDREPDNENDIYYSNILLPGASFAVRQFYNNDFESKARIEKRSIFEQTEFIYLTHRPIASITTVTLDGSPLQPDAFRLISQSGALKLTARPIFFRGNDHQRAIWPFGDEHIQIDYIGGEALTRGHKWLFCKMIAKLDDEDKRGFKSAEDAEESVTQTLTDRDLFGKMFNTFRRIKI